MDVEANKERRPSERREGCLQMFKSEFHGTNFRLDHPNPQLFVISQWGNEKFYLGWRVFWAVYFLGWSIYDWTNTSLTSPVPSTWLIYLTNWSFLLLTISAIARAVNVITKKDFTDEPMPWYMKGTWLLYEVISTGSILVSMLYFGLLFNGTLTVMSTVTHLSNSIYVIADLFVTATPVRVLHVVYAMIYAGIYSIFTVVYWAANGKDEKGNGYIYKPLDWNKPQAAAPLMVASAFAGVPICHLLVWSLYIFRLALHRCLCPAAADETKAKKEMRPTSSPNAVLASPPILPAAADEKKEKKDETKEDKEMQQTTSSNAVHTSPHKLSTAM